MSHTATVAIDIKSSVDFAAACKRLKIKYSLDEEVRLFDGMTVRGMTAYLPGWKYPAVFKDGKAFIDTYKNECWGKLSELDKLKQAYSIEGVKRVARMQGKRVTQNTLKDGSVQLRVQG